MKAKKICVSCILHDIEGAIANLGLAPESGLEVMREVREFLDREFDGSRTPAHYITESHRILKRVSGIVFPFEKVREQANRVGMEAAEKVREEIGGLPAEERFETLVRYAIAGNELDFRTIGTGYGMTEEEIANKLREAAARPLAVDEVGKTFEEAGKVGQAGNAGNVLFIHDNVGEIALDRLLVEEIGRMGAEVTSALRGGPMTSDATVEDGELVGMGKVARVITAGPDTLGISFEEMTGEMRRALAEADLVFSKGQANYYVLSEHREEVPAPIVFLFRTKCDVVAARFGGRGRVGVAALR